MLTYRHFLQPPSLTQGIIALAAVGKNVHLNEHKQNNFPQACLPGDSRFCQDENTNRHTL